MNRNFIRWIIIIVSFVIISLILWNTYVFFQFFKAEERTKMENWSFAQEVILQSTSDTDLEVISRIIESNTTTPMLLVNENDSIITGRNIEERLLNDQRYSKNLLNEFESENRPIEVNFENELFYKIYYGNTPLINKLKYYPLALMLIIFLFGAVVFFFYRSSKNAAQNKLWTGMAKETAHQIGTPLSSLVGWTEILRSENVNPDYLVEIEKDINRLHTITERFSKIGSLPKMRKTDLVKETLETYDYLKARSSNLIHFEIEAPNKAIYVNLNAQLYSWTIENLVKNAIDAMKGKGDLKVKISENDKFVKVTVKDNGKGISKHQYNKVFEPGYTSKKRGWGLGLSLAKRIIEDYHNGKIKVLKSEIGKGTTMQISLRIV